MIELEPADNLGRRFRGFAARQNVGIPKLSSAGMFPQQFVAPALVSLPPPLYITAFLSLLSQLLHFLSLTYHDEVFNYE